MDWDRAFDPPHETDGQDPFDGRWSASDGYRYVTAVTPTGSANLADIFCEETGQSEAK